MPERYLAFLAASLVLAAAPGPDIIFVLSQAALYGARSGLIVLAGLLTGLVLQTMAAALGIAAVVAASPVLFWGVRLAGAAYLLWLAWSALRAGADAAGSDPPPLPASRLYRRGVVMNVTNPKVQIFFLAFFPQFVSPGAGPGRTALQMLILGAGFIACAALVFTLVSCAAATLSDRLRRGSGRLWLERAAAAVFVLLALAIFWD